MDAELATIFSNIASLVDQAKQMLGGGAGAPPAAEKAEGIKPEDDEKASPDVAEKIMKFLKEMDEPEKKEEKPGEVEKSAQEKVSEKKEEKPGEVEKSAQEKVSTPDEGVNASDKAPAIVEETTPDQEKNINSIARALAGMMANKSIQSVKKSDSSKEMYTVLKAIVDDQNDIKKAISNILSGLGVADQIKKMNEVEKSEAQNVRRPMNDQNEIQKSLDYIKQELGASRNNQPIGNNSDTVHKSLADALNNMVVNR